MSTKTKSDPVKVSHDRAKAATERRAALETALEGFQSQRSEIEEAFNPTDADAAETAVKAVSLDWAVVKTREKLNAALNVEKRAVRDIVPTVPLLAQAMAYAMGDRWLGTEAIAVSGRAPAKPDEVTRPVIYVAQNRMHEVSRYGGLSGEVIITGYMPSFLKFGPNDGRRISQEIGQALRDVRTQSGFHQMTASTSNGTISLTIRVSNVYPEKPTLSAVETGVVEQVVDLARPYGLPSDRGSVYVDSVDMKDGVRRSVVRFAYADATGFELSEAGIRDRQRRGEVQGAGLVGRVVPGVGRVTEFDKVKFRTVEGRNGAPALAVNFYAIAESVTA